MDNRILVSAAKKLSAQRRRKMWQRIVAALCVVAVVLTVAVLTLPASTMEEKTVCGLEEHTHTEECYAPRELVCGQEEAEGHTHTEACYGTEEVLVCETEESEEHAHTEECYETREVLLCELEETEGHVHTEECWSPEELICGMEEHIHGEECYPEPEIPEGDPNADVETAAEWEASLSGAERTGRWNEDVLSVAKTQLGYRESVLNYIVENGRKMGYSRYGDWYGNAYGDWCAMFVSFCLHYAGVSSEYVPYDANCPNWIEALTIRKLYRDAEEYEPKPGDIIFFDWDLDDRADHVGLVSSADVAEKDGEMFLEVTTIEGNSADTVQYVKYRADESCILGYGELPENARLLGERVFTFEDDDYLVTVTLPGVSTVPDDAQLIVTQVEKDSEDYRRAAAAGMVGEQTERPGTFLLNIGLYVDGEEIETDYPAQVDVVMKNTTLGEEEHLSVVHLKDNGETERLSAANNTEDGSVTFETDSFSVFLLDRGPAVWVVPMMQSVDRSQDNVLSAGSGYIKKYKPRETNVVYTDDDQMVWMQISDAYEGHDLDLTKGIRLHFHADPDAVTEDPENPCCNDSEILAPGDFIIMEEESGVDEDGSPYKVVKFPQAKINDKDGWCAEVFYTIRDDLAGKSFSATFFDYDYSGNNGIGINSYLNYPEGSSENSRLAMGLKDGSPNSRINRDASDPERLANYDGSGYSWRADVTFTDDKGSTVTKDANANYGQAIEERAGYPVIPGLIQGLSDDLQTIIWKDGIYDPGFFTNVGLGKFLYTDFTLEFHRVGDTYVLEGVNDGNGNSVTDGVYSKTTGERFWPLDGVSGLMYRSGSDGLYHNWYFGMRMDLEFTVPEEYIGPLEYRFFGDDDLWAFLDGELVMDLGGIHSTYPNAYAIEDLEEKGIFSMNDNRNYACYFSPSNVVDLRDKITPGTHTLTILYMERGGYDSNCYMEFTLPDARPCRPVVLPKPSLTVEKVDNQNNPLQNVQFTLYKDAACTQGATFFTDTQLQHKVTNGAASTNADGKLLMVNLEDGTYYLKETATPNDYQPLEGVICSFVVQNGVMTVQDNYFLADANLTSYGSGISLKVTNLKKPTPGTDYIRVTKRFEGITPDQIPEDFHIHMRKRNVGNWMDLYTKLSDSRLESVSADGLTWTWIISNMTADGTFRVQENGQNVPHYDVTTTGLGENLTITKPQLTIPFNSLPGQWALDSYDAYVSGDKYEFVIGLKDNRLLIFTESTLSSSVMATIKNRNWNGRTDFNSSTVECYSFEGRDTITLSGLGDIMFNRETKKVTFSNKGNFTRIAQAHGSAAEMTKPELTVVNTYTPTPGSLSIKKQVTGKEHDPTKFTFEVTLMTKDGAPLTGQFTNCTLAGAPYTLVSNAEGKAEFRLADGEEMLINGLPVGTHWTVKESPHDQYRIAYVVEGENLGLPQVTGSIDEAEEQDEVLCVNIATFTLPATGGSGARPYYIAGTVLLLTAALLFAAERRRKAKEVVISK